MKKLLAVVALLSLGVFSAPAPSSAADLSYTLKGRILIQAEEHGEAWYVNPVNRQRYFLGRPADAFAIMRELGLGIKHTTLTTYLRTGFPLTLSGRIMLDVENHGEAYYVSPVDRKGYYLGRPADAFAIMRAKGLGITNANLATIPISYRYTAYEDVLTNITFDGATHWIGDTEHTSVADIPDSEFFHYNNYYWKTTPMWDASVPMSLEIVHEYRQYDTWAEETKAHRDLAMENYRLDAPIIVSERNFITAQGYDAYELIFTYQHDANAAIAQSGRWYAVGTLVAIDEFDYYTIIGETPVAQYARVKPVLNNVVNTLAPLPTSPIEDLSVGLESVIGEAFDPTKIFNVNVPDTTNPITTKQYTSGTNFTVSYNTDWGVMDLSTYLPELNAEIPNIASGMTPADYSEMATDLQIDVATAQQMIDDLSKMQFSNIVAMAGETIGGTGIIRMTTSAASYDWTNSILIQALNKSAEMTVLSDVFTTINGKSARVIKYTNPDNSSDKLIVTAINASPTTGYLLLSYGDSTMPGMEGALQQITSSLQILQ